MAKTYLFWEPLSDNILQERDEFGGIVAEYSAESGLYGNVVSQRRGGVESQFHFDAQGSTLALTNGNQQITDTRAYSAFGGLVESDGATAYPFRYIGRSGYYSEKDHNVYGVRRRYYTHVTARWLSVDPMAVQLNNGDANGVVKNSSAFLPNPNVWQSDESRGRSTYRYCLNRPTSLIDPSGLITLEQTIEHYCRTECDNRPASCLSACMSHLQTNLWHEHDVNVLVYSHWLFLELVDTSWMQNLPACPCTINCESNAVYDCERNRR